ncbi:MAG TPA: glycosyltransferase family 2 protein [Thermoanaerobaculia bacterium]|jgi:GT2 family glycosyltransferase|nr:glycosyltransferase family 2 protein [Thermoanaerobaculia bacterium]
MKTTEIIIVNWNNRRETLECVAAVEAQLTGGASITVVDNGSTDGSATAVAAKHPDVKLFALPENRGFTGGLAAALSGSTADHVIFLNNDAVPEPGWLAAFTEAIVNAADDVIAVGGKIVDPTGAKIDFIGGVLTFDGHAFQNGFRYPVGSRPEPSSGEEILFACGGNMIARRAPLMELGAFDDDFFAYLEDVDFGWRSWICGWRVTFEPRACVRHAASTTSNRLGDFERGVLFERNALQTSIKNYENLGESASAVLFAYLHRLHHYATTRNPRADELTRTLFAPSKRKRRWPKTPLAAIDDPLTAMQFRAFEWIVKNDARLAQKRRDVQQRRKRSDREIFERFPLHFVPTYPGDAQMMGSALFRLLRPSLPSEEKTIEEIMRT